MPHPTAMPDLTTAVPSPRPNRQDYRMLSDFRYLIRCFLNFSTVAAHSIGLPSRQHQALLAIKGFAGNRNPTLGQLAERLKIQHHSAVELVDRLAEAGLIVRSHDPGDRRRVLLLLTQEAEHHLSTLSKIHLDELRRLRPALQEILSRFERSEIEMTGLPGSESGS
ncbi:MAG TPA: MarR family transcriptional regulator [Rhodopila sp.]|nr:MarR family transcriptional regulator [Rhodopila sp.]